MSVPDPSARPGIDRPRPSGPRAISIALAMTMMLAFAGSIWIVRKGTRSARDGVAGSGSQSAVDPDYGNYVGDVSCRECHPGESASHGRSGHSRTLRSAARVALEQRLGRSSGPGP